jgi:hypothetical protein
MFCVFHTGCFIMFSVITNIYNKKIKGPTVMELFTATGKLIFFLDNYRHSMCAPLVARHTSNISSCQGGKKPFSVAVKNSINPLALEFSFKF